MQADLVERLERQQHKSTELSLILLCALSSTKLRIARGSKLFANFGKSSLGGSKQRPMLHRVGSQMSVRHDALLRERINHHPIPWRSPTLAVLHRSDPGN